MSSLMMKISVLLFVLPPTAAHGNELKVLGNFCVPAAELFERAEMCEDNYLFVQSADSCVERLNREVAAATAELNKNFVKNDGKNQSLNFNSSLRDYNISSKTLARLISINKQAIADVTAYYPSLMEPEDLEEAGEEWGESVACWARSRRAILHVTSVLKTKLANLEHTKRIADAHDSTSNRREVNNGVITGGKAGAKQTTAAGAGTRVPAGKSVNGTSDISGVKEDKAKKAKGEALLKK